MATKSSQPRRIRRIITVTSRHVLTYDVMEVKQGRNKRYQLADSKGAAYALAGKSFAAEEARRLAHLWGKLHTPFPLLPSGIVVAQSPVPAHKTTLRLTQRGGLFFRNGGSTLEEHVAYSVREYRAKYPLVEPTQCHVSIDLLADGETRQIGGIEVKGNKLIPVGRIGVYGGVK